MQGRKSPAISNSGLREPELRADRLPTALTWLLGIFIALFLAGLVVSRRGNLAWDDADYLRRGLRNARIAEGAGALWVVPRAIDRLLLEQPKPPWLVAWIELGVHVIGRRNVDLLILFSSVAPYAFLMAAVTLLGRRLLGAWGGLLALVCLASSPLSLAYGGKVMVESYLSLWVLLIYGLAAFYLSAPSRKIAAAMGLVVGLALLTKLTIALFLPGPLVYGLASTFRSNGDRRHMLRNAVLGGAVCLAVAGPWYAKNARAAVKFAVFSSRYNAVAQGRLDRVAVTERIARMAGGLAGWPLAATIAAAAIVAAVSWSRGVRDEAASSGHGSNSRLRFARMAWLGSGIAAGILLVPTYFDTRFLLPAWPILAVAISSSISIRLPRLPLIPKGLLGLGFAASLLFASATVAREPLFPTYWKTADLIDDLVDRFGVSNLVNVGNCAAWNVCKTGLMNELREHPDTCFVLHDLTKIPDARALRLLKRADAVIVLGRSDLPEAILQAAPGLNRGYGAVVENLERDVSFSQIAAAASNGLPNLLVYVRRSHIEQAREMSKFDGGRRR